MIKECIKELSMGNDLTSAGMRESMNEIMEGVATPAQIGAFLALLRIKGESVNEITQAARVMREKAHSIDIEPPMLDTCSTGGTGLNHVNISTTVAFLAAAAGIKLAKHGNRAATGRCGSADVLEKLGVNIEIEPDQVKTCIENTGIGFLFAPKFHKAMKYAASPRKEVGIRTIFNMLGPLTNPASASHQLLGVYSPELTEPLASVLGNLGVKRAMVVHGAGGLDEISLSGPTRVSELKEDSVETYNIDPSDFGLENVPLESITGGDEDTNAGIIRETLAGKNSPFMHYVIANCSAALFIMDRADTLKEGADMARDLLESGKAARKLEDLIRCSQELK